jgi:benzoylformate decarboxylase
MTHRTGGELIQDFLGTYEIPFVFGNPGTTETTFLAAVSASKATYVLSLHESSAVGIAVCGQLPPTTKEIHDILSVYQTMLLIGEKVDTFTYDGRSAMPSGLQVIQIAPATSQLGFDYPCDIAVLGEIKATLNAIATELGASPIAHERTADLALLEAKYSPSGKHPSDALILGILRHLDLATHVITEGSSEDAVVQDMAVRLGFRKFIFRRAAAVWAGPCRLALGSG